MPYELLINRLVDGLETPCLVKMRHLPIPKTTPNLKETRPAVHDPMLTDPKVFSNATETLIKDLKKMINSAQVS